MTVMGITLLIAGVIIFALSFIIPDKEEKLSRREKEKLLEKQREEIHKMMEKELDGMKLRVNEATNETVEYGMDKCERSLEKISNEKIMAVNEYAATIMDEIDRNHKEIMFLYDMLNDKQVDIKNTVRKAEATAKEVNEAAKSVQESYDAAQQEYERQIAGQAAFMDSMFAEQPQTIPAAGTSVMYHGNIDESIFENMTRTDLDDEKSYSGYTQNYVNVVPGNGVQSADNMMPTVTSVFNTVINDEREGILSDNATSFATDIPVETIERPVEEAVYVQDQAELKDDMRGASFRGEGNNNQKILDLHSRGMDVVDIARELNLGVGEVKLVIDLYR